MSPETMEQILRRNPGSANQTLRTLEDLIRELREESGVWENATLDCFLKAMHAWLTAVQSRAPDPPSWKLIEMMLKAAKVYE